MRNISARALIKSAWVKDGAHIDLVGAFTPKMREADADLINRAAVFVDTREGAMQEAGDLILAAQLGKFELWRHKSQYARIDEQTS